MLASTKWHKRKDVLVDVGFYTSRTNVPFMEEPVCITLKQDDIEGVTSYFDIRLSISECEKLARILAEHAGFELPKLKVVDNESQVAVKSE